MSPKIRRPAGAKTARRNEKNALAHGHGQGHAGSQGEG